MLEHKVQDGIDKSFWKFHRSININVVIVVSFLSQVCTCTRHKLSDINKEKLNKLCIFIMVSDTIWSWYSFTIRKGKRFP